MEPLQGTLDLLVLRTLLPSPAHGHAIAKNIERDSEDVLQVEQGSLYPALHSLIERGWITAEGGKGRKQLSVETTRWEKLARAITGILRAAGQEGKS